MKLEGRIIEFDAFARTGKIEDVSGKVHLNHPNSFRRTVKLNLGDEVQFTSWNLSNGPTALDVVPI